MLWKIVYTFLVVLIVPSAFSASVGPRRLKREISYITFCPIIDGETSVEECQQIYIRPGQCSPFEQYSWTGWRNVKRVAVDAPCVRLYSARGCVGYYREITEERGNGNVSNDFSSFLLCNWHINGDDDVEDDAGGSGTSPAQQMTWESYELHLAHPSHRRPHKHWHTLVFLNRTRVHESDCDLRFGQTLCEKSRILSMNFWITAAIWCLSKMFNVFRVIDCTRF